MVNKKKLDITINRDEFADLIFSQNENLTVDLQNLAPIEAIQKK